MPGMDDVFADAQAVKASDAEISAIGTLVKQALALQDEIEAMSDALKARQGEYRAIVEQSLPEAMDAANCGEFKDKDSGKKIRLKDDVKASISEKNRPPAHAWMRNTGHEDLIKNQLVVPLSKGQDNIAGKIAEEIEAKYGVTVERKETIHSQTLMAFCREQLEAGNDTLPRDLLGIYIRRVAEIK